MSKHITLTKDQWSRLKSRLHVDYPPSVLLISWKCREVLGFSVRTYFDYNSNQYICLDFYNEPKRTMFLLKYGEYLDADKG